MAPPPVYRRPRRVTPEELALWQLVVHDARPRHPGPEVPAAAPAPAPASAAPATPAAPPPAAPPAKAVTPAAVTRTRRLDPRGPVDLDRRTWQRLRRGRLGIEGRLDLHGMTQAEAHAALSAFLAAAQRRGARCVLVITGRGLLRGGTLREMTPRWLDEPPNRARVVSYAKAQLEHGGDGAIYVLLRRVG